MRPKVCASAIAGSLSVGLSLGFAAYVMTTTPTTAGCIDGIGCTRDKLLANSVLYDATCGELWYLRNSVLDDNGFCFRSARGRSTFSNAGCRFKRADDVPMSQIERTNVKSIKGVEKRRGCK